MAASDAANEARLAAAAKAAKPLTQAEIDAKTAATVAAGGKSTDPANRLKNETASEANARITAAYKAQAQPELTKEGKAAGATIEWVRTGAGGVGTYKEVFPMGTPIPTTRTTESGNVYDASGKLISGTGLKTTKTGSTTAVTKTITNTVKNADGSSTITYSDGTSVVVPKPADTLIVTPTDKPVGTPPAYVYNKDSKTWEQPPKPTGAGNWVFDNNNGWTDTTVVPGSTGSEAGSEKILAKDTFKNTLALYFGPAEMSKPWVDGLYKSVSSFYKTGSTVAESLNLSLMDIRNNPDMSEFTKRFKGVYALTDRLAGGEAVSVPTIAEYFASEAAMGDTLREAGLGDIATQDFLGDVIGRGKSVLEVGKLITDTFTAIDNAPKALKDTLAEYFPTVDRVSLAKALLTGKEGAAALDKKIKGISVLSAAGTQGVKTDLATAGDIAAMGYGYTEALEGFGTVKQLERANVLAGFEGGKFTQEQAQGYVFGKNIAEEERIRLLKEKETARFSGRSGLAASALRGQSTNTIL
jgi:hypothetical protein